MHRPILFLDSGVGGLTVLTEVRRAQPAHDYLYIADWENFPYGELAPDELVARLLRLLGHAIALYAPQLVVVACNTASTVVLTTLRSHWPEVPFVGVVPAVKPAAAMTRTGCIAVLATAGTVRNGYTERLCQEFAPQCQVELIAASALVAMAEGYMADDRYLLDLAPVAQEIRSRAPSADTCVLACTHFPILRVPLQQALPEISNWVDSGAAIARRVEALVQVPDVSERVGDLRLLCTDHPRVQRLSQHWQNLLGISQPHWQRLTGHRRSR